MINYLRKNEDALEQALQEIVKEFLTTRPITAEIATNMLNDHDVKIGMLAFITRLRQRCPAVLDEICRQVKMDNVY